jgi:hypothetical protein
MIDLLGSPFRKLIIFGALVADVFIIIGIGRLIGYAPDDFHDHLIPILTGAGVLYMIESLIVGFVRRDPEGIRAWSHPLEWAVLVILALATIGTAYLG